MIITFENVALAVIGVILLLLAVAATYVIIQEVIRLFADIGHNRDLAVDDEEEAAQPARRIKPFRDRGTVERLIGYFSKQDKN